MFCRVELIPLSVSPKRIAPAENAAEDFKNCRLSHPFTASPLFKMRLNFITCHNGEYPVTYISNNLCFETGDIGKGIFIMNKGLQLNPRDLSSLHELANRLIEKKI